MDKFMKMRLSDLKQKLNSYKEVIGFLNIYYPLMDTSELEFDQCKLNDLLYNINANRNYPYDVWVDTITGEVEE